jgi:diaminohydroxyphosphoribosylaminopyrimidine deaminase / 5-amino-6-(5-phosphoribosylamino)uracil reductase
MASGHTGDAVSAGEAPEDTAYMQRALDLARRGWGHTAPNPMVGAVIVRAHEVVGEGYHARYGGEHAEAAALRAAGERAAGATVYVTLEPCTHTGQTPPCAGALIRAGVRRVVVAIRDPHPGARGGLQVLEAAGIHTTVGPEAAAARELNAPFLHALHADRPWLTLKLAVSLDGAVRDAACTTGWLTGPAARAEVHRMRAGSDAIAVGIGTVLADDPLLTVRDAPPPRVPPLRVVFDHGVRLPLSSRLARSVDQGPVCVIAGRAPDPGRAAQLADAGVEVLAEETLGDALRALRARGVRSLLAEGGPRLTGSLLGGSAADRLVIFQAPIVLGTGAEPAFAFVPAATVSGAPRWPIVARHSFGSDTMTIYGLSEP